MGVEPFKFIIKLLKFIFIILLDSLTIMQLFIKYIKLFQLSDLPSYILF